MNYRLIEARHIAEFTLWLRFSDGVEGEIDLRAEIYGSVGALRNWVSGLSLGSADYH